jgi:pilus assembly protein CpaB
VSLRSILIVVLALVCGGSAAVGITSMRDAPPPAPKPETVSVVVAEVDVPRFTTLSPQALSTRDWPKNNVPPGAFASVEEAVGRVASAPLVKGEPILDARLAPRGAGRGVAAAIPKGMRACTIQTPNVATGVAGLLQPGYKVDVILTVSGQAANDGAGGASTLTLLQNVEILAVDQRVDAPADHRIDAKELRSVTLLVTPDQAAKLDLGQTRGTLHLSLRNPEDDTQVSTSRTTLTQIGLFPERQAAPAPAPAPPRAARRADPTPAYIRTLRGNVAGRAYVQAAPQTSDQQ